MIIFTASSFHSLILQVIVPGKNKWYLMVDYYNFNAAVLSTESSILNTIYHLNY